MFGPGWFGWDPKAVDILGILGLGKWGSTRHHMICVRYPMLSLFVNVCSLVPLRTCYCSLLSNSVAFYIQVGNQSFYIHSTSICSCFSIEIQLILYSHTVIQLSDSLAIHILVLPSAYRKVGLPQLAKHLPSKGESSYLPIVQCGDDRFNKAWFKPPCSEFTS